MQQGLHYILYATEAALYAAGAHYMQQELHCMQQRLHYMQPLAALNAARGSISLQQGLHHLQQELPSMQPVAASDGTGHISEGARYDIAMAPSLKSKPERTNPRAPLAWPAGPPGQARLAAGLA